MSRGIGIRGKAMCPSVAGAPVHATTHAIKPLRFIVCAGMDPADGDTVNPTCYSNIISRLGPAGRGGRLPAAGIRQ